MIKIEITGETGLDVRKQLADLIYGTAPTRDELYEVVHTINPANSPIVEAMQASAGEAAKRTRRSKKEDAPVGGENPPSASVAADSTAAEAGETSTGMTDAGQTPSASSTSTDGSDAKVFTKAEVKSRLTDLTLKIGAAPAITFMHTVTNIPKFNDVPDTLYPKLMAALEKKLAE